jgi:hypothetical protein
VTARRGKQRHPFELIEVEISHLAGRELESTGDELKIVSSLWRQAYPAAGAEQEGQQEQREPGKPSQTGSARHRLTQSRALKRMPLT